MSKVLGKRKLRALVEQDVRSTAATEIAAGSVQDIFRRHFESQFKPLASQLLKKAALPADTELVSADNDTNSEAEDSEWGGISSEEEDTGVEVVDYTSTSAQASNLSMSKREMRAYMVFTPKLRGIYSSLVGFLFPID
jgi:hypothetical protein